MRTFNEEIATEINGPYRVQFGRVIIGDYERFYISVNRETVALRPEVIGAFLEKINAYMAGYDTLNGNALKSGISTGNANPSQRVNFQPLEQPPVRSADFTRGARP